MGRGYSGNHPRFSHRQDERYDAKEAYNKDLSDLWNLLSNKVSCGVSNLLKGRGFIFDLFLYYIHL